mgnify:FL=1
MVGLINLQIKDHMPNKPTNLSISKTKLSNDKVTAELSYKYLEKRDYIQGVVVLDGMLKCCEKLLPDIKQKNFKIVEAKINSKINFNTKAIAYFSKNINQEKKNKIAVLKIRYNSKNLVCDLYKNSKKINNKYREKKDIYGKHVTNIKKNKNFVDCEIKKIFGLIDLIRAIEECHRDIIKSEKNEYTKIKWCYLTNLVVNNKKIKKIKKIKFFNKKVFKSPRSEFDIRTVDFYKINLKPKPTFCFNASK